MLIDDFLSEYDFVETHSTRVHASPESIYRAAREVDFSESCLIRLLFGFRGLSTNGLTLASLKTSRFEILAQTPGREFLLGLVGKFWAPFGDLKRIDAESFKTFKTPGYAKAAWNFALSPEGKDVRLSTETRIKCTDSTSRSMFGLYWTLIRPFSGLIRMEMLRLIKNRAES